MVKSKNIIRKQVLDFQYKGKAEPFVLQKEVSDWCRLSLIPEMEQRLESFDLGDHYISIDKLEIEASIDGKDWKKKLKDSLMEKLESQLGSIKSSSQEEVIQSKSLPAKMDELMVFYFQNGYLPWWGNTLIENGFEELLLKWLDKMEDNTEVEVFNKNLKEIISPEMIQRMVNIIPRRYFFQLLRGLYNKEKKLITSLETFFKGSLETEFPSEKQKIILQLMFKWIVASDGNELLKGEKSQSFLFKEIYRQTGILLTVKGDSGLKKEATDLKKEATGLKKEDSDLQKEGPDLKRELSVKEENELKSILSDSKVEKRLAKQEISVEGLYIQNAGAIIIAPFLPVLFKKLKVIEGAKVLDPQTAVLAIQYAVNGNEKVEEYDLVLPKILCALEVEFVIDATKEITANQKNEVNEMLSSLIEHWSVLKNTSIAGLQETFLKRDGKLSAQDNDWLLQVEQKSYDMLLNQLPYNINMIKMPWMERIIRMEWV